MKKPFLSLVFLLALLSLFPVSARAGIPAALKFSQHTSKLAVNKTVTITRTFPATSNRKINAEMKTLINRMTKAGKEKLPKEDALLDVGASVYRTGDRWMSFLTIARITSQSKQLGVDFDARVYDMKSGKQLRLTDLFAPESEGWALLARAVKKQLSAYFSTITPRADRLKALYAREALESAAFTLTPAKLSIHYKASDLYPGKKTLMHVNLYYRELRRYMTPLGKRITDNRRYPLVALTYDDGPAVGSSMQVMNKLRLHGADATFFLVGTNMRGNEDIVCREHDAGYAVASHNYYHEYKNITPENVRKWKQAFDRKLNSIVGIRPSYMRAPGGSAWDFAKARCGLPLIQWSRATHDAPFGNVKADEILSRARYGMKDGAIILMHDLNAQSPVYTQALLKELESKGFLCVTVDELFFAYGITLRPNRIYKNAEKAAQRK